MVKNAPILLILGVRKQLMERIHHTKYEQDRSIFENLDLGPKFWDFVKNAPIWLIFGVMNSFLELFSGVVQAPTLK